jgi:hypothetical protein
VLSVSTSFCHLGMLALFIYIYGALR